MAHKNTAKAIRVYGMGTDSSDSAAIEDSYWAAKAPMKNFRSFFYYFREYNLGPQTCHLVMLSIKSQLQTFLFSAFVS